MKNFVYDPTLALYLPLWQKDSPTFMSSDHYGHLVTRTGAVWTSQGHSLDGVDDSFLLGDPASLELGSSPFTIEVVCRRTETGRADRILGKIAGGWVSGSWQLYFETDDKLYFADAAATSVSTTETFAANIFYHIIVSKTGTGAGGLTITVNNILKATGTCIDFGNSPDNLYLGRLETSGYFKGLISEASIYLRAFNVSERTNHYIAAKRRLPWL